MKVILLHYTPLHIADHAIGKCWDKTTDKPEARMYRVANKFKHASTIEHVTYNFDIDGISRACLQELARHRMQNMSVKSSRYTLGELDKSESLMSFLVPVDPEINNANVAQLRKVKESKSSNDIRKYMLPEAYKTSLVSTMNMRALQNFLSLRTDKSALWEIQELAHKMFEVVPEEHKFMLKDFIKVYDDN